MAGRVGFAGVGDEEEDAPRKTLQRKKAEGASSSSSSSGSGSASSSKKRHARVHSHSSHFFAKAVITVLECKNLPCKSKSNMDPYVRVFAGSNCSVVKPKKKTADPQWTDNNVFEEDVDRDDIIQFRVYNDQDKFKYEFADAESIAHRTFEVKRVTDKDSEGNWYTLKPSGEIRVKIEIKKNEIIPGQLYSKVFFYPLYTSEGMAPIDVRRPTMQEIQLAVETLCRYGVRWMKYQRSDINYTCKLIDTAMSSSDKVIYLTFDFTYNKRKKDSPPPVRRVVEEADENEEATKTEDSENNEEEEDVSTSFTFVRVLAYKTHSLAIDHGKMKIKGWAKTLKTKDVKQEMHSCAESMFDLAKQTSAWLSNAKYSELFSVNYVQSPISSHSVVWYFK